MKGFAGVRGLGPHTREPRWKLNRVNRKIKLGIGVHQESCVVVHEGAQNLGLSI